MVGVLRWFGLRNRKIWTVLLVFLVTLSTLSLIKILRHQQIHFFVHSPASLSYSELKYGKSQYDLPQKSESHKDLSSESDGAKLSRPGSISQQYFLEDAGNYTGAKDGLAEDSQCPLTLCNKGTCFENMVCHKPFEYLENYKNPCFYEQVKEDDSDQSVYKNLIILRMMGTKQTSQSRKFHQLWQKRRRGKTEQLRCLPYFFIIGMEKCGTTDLYTRINAHPDIILSPAKELQWWTRRRFFIKQNGTYPGHLQADAYKMEHTESLVSVPFSHYYAFFDQVSANIEQSYIRTNNGQYHYRITGDGSPNTVYWNDFAEIYAPVPKDGPTQIVAHHIAAVLPQAKIICILRNPIDRLYSSYLFFNRGVTKETFHSTVQRGIKKFHQCVIDNSLRFCVYDWRLKEEVGPTANLMQGVYSVMISDWLKVFNSSQLHVIHFESYKKSELVELNKAFVFLRVQTVDADTPEGQAILQKDTSLQGSQYDFVGKMLPKTRSILENFYKPYNKQLADILDDDRFLWTTS